MKNKYLKNFGILLVICTTVIFANMGSVEAKRIAPNIVDQKSTVQTPDYSEGEIEINWNLVKYYRLGTKIILDASKTRTLSLSIFRTPRYSWVIEGITSPKIGRKVSFRPEKVGVYNIRSQVRQGKISAEKDMNIVVYDDEALWVGNQEISSSIINTADNKGVKITNIFVESEGGVLAAEEKFMQIWSENKKVLINAKYLFFRNNNISALQSLIKFQGNNISDVDLSKKSIILLTLK